jgi:hypothetical protein
MAWFYENDVATVVGTHSRGKRGMAAKHRTERELPVHRKLIEAVWELCDLPADCRPRMSKQVAGLRLADLLE